jgi:alpha-methylacyl-CoA racemase
MGPLQGIQVIELAGLGPAPMAGMMLADMGAEVIRIERSSERPANQQKDVSHRGKKSVALNIKSAEGAKVLLKLLERADVLIDPFRPGVMERLGVGPEVCLERNPRLIYGRMTGWGQEGELAQAAGHDINYIALTGALFATGRPGERPVPALNLLADMAGGGMLLAYGVVCAVLERARSGKGQVIDAAMIDGVAQLMWMMHSFQAAGLWNAAERGVNLLDGGAPFYDVYETSDRQYIAVGPLEPKFYAELLKCTGVDAVRFKNSADQALWPALRSALMQAFKHKTRAEWEALIPQHDACMTPVLSFLEAPDHPHNKTRNAYVEVDGFQQAAPAPRFSRTPGGIRHGQRAAGSDSVSVLKQAGFNDEQIASLTASGTLMVSA